MEYPSEIKVGNSIFRVEYGKALKGTSSVRIRNNRVVLKLSRYVWGGQREEMVQKFLKWAEKKLAKAEINDFVLPEYKDGGRVCTHNKIYELRVRVEERVNSKTKLNGDVIEISVCDKNCVRDLAERIIIKDQEDYLWDVVNELNQLYFQEEFVRVRFKRMNHRFGSCSSRRSLNIAFRLLYAPREVFRYVCLHELAHLKEMNHSKRFWKLVSDAMPEYKEHEKWLKRSGFMLG